MPVTFLERKKGDLFEDRINLGKQGGDGFVRGNSLKNAYVQLDNGRVVPGEVSIISIVWDQGRPGRCFVFTPENSEEHYQFSDSPLQIQAR